MENENTNKSSNLFKVLTGVFLVTSIVLGVLLFRSESTIKVVTVSKNNIAAEKELMINKLESLQREYDQMVSENSNLNGLVAEERQKVAELIAELKTSKGNLAVFNAKIMKLEKKLKDYLVQIGELKAKNEVITSEKVKLAYVLDSTTSVSMNLKTQNTELNKKVESAAVLKAYEVVANAMKVKGDKEIPTTSYKRTNKIKVCFVISENAVIPKGQKTVYLRISRPDGKLFYKSESDLFMFNNQNIVFSSQQEINYQGKAIELCMNYNQPDELTKGVYEVDIFVDNAAIGNTFFRLE